MNHNSVEILLVEDNVNDAELTIHELKKHSMANNLFHVSDGEEALEFIFGTGKYSNTRDVAFSPRLILLDINMPKVNGIEVLEAIKADDRTKTTPVVILTSSKEDPDIRHCYALGVNSYIVKPVNFKSFADAIKNLGFFLAAAEPDAGKITNHVFKKVVNAGNDCLLFYLRKYLK